MGGKHGVVGYHILFTREMYPVRTRVVAVLNKGAYRENIAVTWGF